MKNLLLLLLTLSLAACSGAERTGSGDDDDSSADDDDTVGDDDDTVGDNDDTVGPGECEPIRTLSCGAGAVDTGNNGGQDSTNQVFEYSCFPGEEFTGPELAYTFVAESAGAHTITLYDFDEDLELFVLDPTGKGACDGGSCLDSSTNAPGEDEQVSVTLQAGETVYVVVEGYAGAVDDYAIRMECPSETASCADPILARPHQENNAASWSFVNGAFAPGPELNPSGQGTVWGVAVGDFTGDGSMDVITERQGNNGLTASLWANDCSTGQLTEVGEPNGFSFPGLHDLHGAADVDGDGDLDVLGIEYFTGEGRVWLNDGTGGAFTAVNEAFELQTWDPDENDDYTSVSFPPVDVGGDGPPDLVECSNQSSSPTSCRVHDGTGNGTFQAGATFQLDRLCNSVVAGDFNGDGAVDFLGGLDDDGDAGQVWMWPGSPVGPSTLPSGGGQEAFDVEPDGGGPDQNDPGYGWMYPSDVDGDGDLDVVVSVMDPFGDLDQTMYLATNDGLGNFTVSEIDDSQSSWDNGDERIQPVVGVPMLP